VSVMFQNKPPSRWRREPI